jgi:hypothetical protein
MRLLNLFIIAVLSLTGGCEGYDLQAPAPRILIM